MNAVTVNNFALDIYKYLEMAKSHMVEIAYGDEVFCLKKKKTKASDGWIPTAQDLEDIRIGREQRAQGRYDYRRENETVEEFFERITAE